MTEKARRPAALGEFGAKTPPMLRPLPPLVDRSFVKIVAYKRLFTGVSSLVAALGLLYVTVRPHAGPTSYAVVGALLFTVGGVWALRDAVRLLRELRK